MQNFDANAIQKKIGYAFKNESLLKNAFVHSSFANENKAKSNERLEFLGDSVLNLIVTDYVYKHYNKFSEGELSKIRASLVSEKSLSFIFEQLGLDRYIMCGAGLKNTKPTNAMMADAFEAVVASIYLDGGMAFAQNFVLKMLSTALEEIKSEGVPESKKSLLQEKHKTKRVIYETKSTGEGQEKVYYSKAIINGVVCGEGFGAKKRDAEEQAAGNALKQVKKV